MKSLILFFLLVAAGVGTAYAVAPPGAVPSNISDTRVTNEMCYVRTAGPNAGQIVVLPAGTSDPYALPCLCVVDFGPEDID